MVPASRRRANAQLNCCLTPLPPSSASWNGDAGPHASLSHLGSGESCTSAAHQTTPPVPPRPPSHIRIKRLETAFATQLLKHWLPTLLFTCPHSQLFVLNIIVAAQSAPELTSAAPHQTAHTTNPSLSTSVAYRLPHTLIPPHTSRNRGSLRFSPSLCGQPWRDSKYNKIKYPHCSATRLAASQPIPGRQAQRSIQALTKEFGGEGTGRAGTEQGHWQRWSWRSRRPARGAGKKAERQFKRGVEARLEGL